MRVSFAVLVAVVAAFISSGLASALNPVQLQQAVPGETNNVAKTSGARFLRKRLEDESDDLAKEDRGVLGDLMKTAMQYVKGEKLLARLFKKSNKQLWAREVTPEYLDDAVKYLENARWPAAKVKQFRSKARQYSNWYYNPHKDV